MTLELRKFNPNSIGDFSVVVVVGKRNTGKSVLVRDILYHKRHIKYGIVCSGTEDGNCFYQQFVPPAFVYNKFDPAVIERVIARQRRALRRGNAEPVFIVLDDLVYDSRFLRTPLMRQLVLNGRHYKIFLVLTTQYLVDVPPGLRLNFDFVICLRDNIYREKLYKNIFMIFPSLDSFQAAMDECTKNYGALVLDNTSSSTKVSDCCFYYKAKLERLFKMGTPEVWRLCKTLMAPASDDEDDQAGKQSKIGTRATSVVIKKK